MATLATVVEAIDRLDTIVPAVQQFRQQHKTYGVQPAQYETAGSPLLRTLQRPQGNDFTPAVRDTWTEAYAILATTMKKAAS